MKTCLKCKKQFPNFITIDGKRHGLYHRSFCLECSPFRSHNCTDISNPVIFIVDNIKYKMCPVCKKKLELNENNFYIKKNKRNYYSQCKICVNIRSKLSVQNFKLECVKYKGGKCELCGYNKLPQALQFHHKNPKEKDFQISNRFTRDMEKVKPELDKCQLLCANCHAEIEAMKPRKGDIKIGYNTETKETCIKGMFQSKDGSIGKIALITWKN